MNLVKKPWPYPFSLIYQRSGWKLRRYTILIWSYGYEEEKQMTWTFFRAVLISDILSQCLQTPSKWSKYPPNYKLLASKIHLPDFLLQLNTTQNLFARLHKISLPDCLCQFRIRKISSFIRNMIVPAVVWKEKNREAEVPARKLTLLAVMGQCWVEGKLFVLSSLLREVITFVSHVSNPF